MLCCKSNFERFDINSRLNKLHMIQLASPSSECFKFDQNISEFDRATAEKFVSGYKL